MLVMEKHTFVKRVKIGEKAIEISDAKETLVYEKTPECVVVFDKNAIPLKVEGVITPVKEIHHLTVNVYLSKDGVYKLEIYV